MSRNIRRRTSAAILALSVGLLGTMEAQAGGSHRADRLTAPKASVVHQLQDFARILWRQAAGFLDGIVSAQEGHHKDSHKPGRECTSNGPAIDPDGRSNGNDRNGNNGNHYGSC